jgi:hypothetical protein
MSETGYISREFAMSRVTESLHKSIIGRKFSKRKVKKTCWNCGFEWKGLQRSFCPRCKGGRLPPEKYAIV